MTHFMFNAILTTANDLVPNVVQNSLHSAYHYLFSPKEITIIVDEHENSQVSSVMSRNQIFEAAMVYLPTKIGPDTRRFKVSKTHSQGSLKKGIEPGVEVVDRFDNNVVLKWKLTQREESEFQKEKHFFELSFKKKYKDTVLDGYLEFVMKESAEIVKNMEKVVKIRGNPDRDQFSLFLHHTITFDKLAMDPELRQAIIDDLDMFKKGQEFYRKVGKAWKRGYLLHGPPGTGKSSLIAAMANHLKYDVYDLELTSFQSDNSLRRILVTTPNRSIIVIEDIDCNVELQVRRTGTTEGSNNPKWTLSGLLNFIDGLWSSCGDERIVVFTTNHKDRLDPALLRPGRMDMVIHMSYCTGQGFRHLAKNYLDINDHPLFGEIEDIMANVKVTPAEVAGQLMSSRKVDIALTGMVNLLKRKMEANEIEEEDEANGLEVREKKRSKIGNSSRN